MPQYAPDEDSEIQDMPKYNELHDTSYLDLEIMERRAKLTPSI